MTKFLLVFAFQSALGAAPLLMELHPRGAQQGTSFTLTISGRDVKPGAAIVTNLPAVFTPMTPSAKGLPFLVELKSEAVVGTYPIRVRSDNGISNVLLFTIGAFPEVEEEETEPHANDTFSSAKIVKSSPVTINGTLTGADRDIYRIAGKAGERRVFEVEARRCGSAIDPVIELYDDKGLKLARNEDATGIGVDSRLDFTFPKDGSYFVEVHDARFSKQDQNFYRLMMGAYPYAESVFPLGGQRGHSIQVEFVTATGPVSATVKLPSEGDFVSVPMPGSPALPFRLALGEYPEVAKPANGTITVPAVVNGRIAKPAEVDRYHLNVSPGESYLFELQCRELETSHLDGLITVYDAKGKKLASAGDAPPVVDVFSLNSAGRTSADPVLNFKVPESTNEVTVAVEDIAQRGGPDYGYRLTVRKQTGDFRVSATPAYMNVPRGGSMQIAVNVDRRGYDGPIQATIPDLPKGWTVAGGYIAAETVDPSNQRSFSRRGVLSLTAAPNADSPMAELTIVADGRLADGSTLRRSAAGLGMAVDIASGTGLPDPSSSDRQKPFTASWLAMKLPAALDQEPIAILEVKPLGHRQMAEGDAYDFEWKLTAKRKDIPMPAMVNADAPGVRDIRVIDMKAAAKNAPDGTFTITTTRATTPAIYDLAITASLMVDGQREIVYSRAIPFEVLKGASSEDSQKAITGSR